MLSLLESIIKSNNASHPAYRFSWYDEDSVISIVVTCNYTAAIPPIFDRVKVKKEYDKLEDIYKKDIRYVFNHASKSKNSILTYLLCIILSCKSYEEIKEKISNLLVDNYFTIDKTGPISGDNNIRIAFKFDHLYSIIAFYKHTTKEYSNYKYVK